MIKESFDDFNELDKFGKINELNNEDFNKIIIEDDYANDIKFLYPESISNGFNFTVNKKN